jgi:hypothetical protein
LTLFTAKCRGTEAAQAPAAPGGEPFKDNDCFFIKKRRESFFLKLEME